MIKEVFHGDDFNASRSALLKVLAYYQEDDYQIVKLDGTKVDENFLTELEKSTSLFGEKRLLVVDNIHAGPKSKKKDELILKLVDSDNEIILWDKKKLTALMLKNFPTAKVSVFNLKNYLWEFLSALSPDQEQKIKLINLLREVLKDNEAYYVLIMMAWQLRQLIAASEGHYSGMPAKKDSMLRKGSAFGTAKLLKIHEQLVQLDYKYKTSQLNLPLEEELEWFIYQEL